MKVIFFALGIVVGVAICALWLHVRYLPQQGELERQAITAKHRCDVRLGALIQGMKEVYQ